ETLNIHGYTPHTTICLTFLSLFSVSMTGCLSFQNLSRAWWWLGTAVICDVLGILGWSTRL
ncbi:hypothetical protein IW262DRAFT_1243362, partial [Armillaria fumosa]